jgi:hypothetical protein
MQHFDAGATRSGLEIDAEEVEVCGEEEAEEVINVQHGTCRDRLHSNKGADEA